MYRFGKIAEQGFCILAGPLSSLGVLRIYITFTARSAVFDEPVLELAEQTGLSELIDQHVDLPRLSPG